VRMVKDRAEAQTGNRTKGRLQPEERRRWTKDFNKR
jgi:hypothetical protein